MPAEAREIAARIRVDPRDVRRGFRQAQTQAQQFTRNMETSAARIKRAWQDVGFGRATSRFRALTSTVGGFVGAYGLAQGVRRVKDFEESIGMLAIKGNKSNVWLKTARDRVLDVSKMYGIAKDDVAGFAEQFTTLTGDVDMAMGMLQKMGKVALATGVDMRTLASVVEQMSGAFKLTGKEAYSAFNVLVAQEKAGTVSFQSIAAMLPMLAGGAAGFGKSMRGMRGIQNLGAMIQMTARTAGGPGEAGTALARFMDNIRANREKLEKLLGKKLMVGGQWKDMEAIAQIVGGGLAAADPTKRAKIEAAFGLRGKKTALAFEQAYRAGWTEKVGARAAASTLFGAGGKDIISGDAIKRAQQDAVKWNKAVADFDAALHKHLLPVMGGLVKLLPALGKGAKFLMENASGLLKAWLALKTAGMFAGLVHFLQAMQGGKAGAGGVAAVAGSFGGVLGPAAAQAAFGDQALAEMQARRTGARANIGLGLAMFAQRLFLVTAAMEALGLVLEAAGADTRSFGDRAKEAAEGLAGGKAFGKKSAFAQAEKQMAGMFLRSEALRGWANIYGREAGDVPAVDAARLNRLRGKRGAAFAQEQLNELLERRRTIVADIQKKTGLRGVGAKELEEVLPGVKELNQTIEVFKHAVAAFNQGKRFQIKIESSEPQKRTQERSTISMPWGMR